MQQQFEIWLRIIAVIIVFSFGTFYATYVIVSKKMSIVMKMMATIVIIAILYLAGDSNTYLPFLGYCAFPPSILLDETRPSKASESLILDLSEIHDVPDGTRVIYWGATNSKDKNKVAPNPMEAYGNYMNSGISVVKDKRATIYYMCPDKYQVGNFMKKVIDRHIHYRLVRPNNPLISPVYTKYVKC